MDTLPIGHSQASVRRRPVAAIVAIAAAAVLAAVLAYRAVLPPKGFPAGSIIEVREGETLSALSRRLEAEKVVRSRSLFQSLVILLDGDRGILAGKYFFEDPLPVTEVARRLATGEHHLEPIRVTFPEGLRAESMAGILAEKLAGFDRQAFLEEAAGKEGYLFPDTYLFYPTATPEEVVATLSQTFEKRMEALEDEVRASGRPLREAIIMASIIEGEANKDADRAVVSGILWRRLAIDMPLQVDTAFKYINGKGSAELTRDDLKIDSPYNTYVYKGLPPTPISNPGLASIRAALVPEKSPYLYYLHDNDGMIHYARTYEEHLRNKAKYLD